METAEEMVVTAQVVMQEAVELEDIQATEERELLDMEMALMVPEAAVAVGALGLPSIQISLELQAAVLEFMDQDQMVLVE